MGVLTGGSTGVLTGGSNGNCTRALGSSAILPPREAAPAGNATPHDTARKDAAVALVLQAPDLPGIGPRPTPST
jgi:hypothetical protein